ncbi:hypothetical protein PHLGIDRAFT_108689 [Phlebiopsis gigantea 11061_1 CR5-6]|uniref:FAD-binding domain-containing protein n=1 Tax=Phlebiopsis gigantea (strain 11061_1 CR5-6) TaxID=745531 RepID=A0A0C3RV73_PHLG1|nr:hypothetical protein PHLGIDRAFT_108689 [Phlebiopsis gigantea 11061_1 CR5-6]
MLNDECVHPAAKTSTTPHPKFRVAICGGGIGGITLAVCLSKHPDIQVDIYEAAQSFKEVGAGVMIWGRTWQVLTLLGMDKTLRDVAGVALDGPLVDPPFGFDFRRSDMGHDHRIYLLSMPYASNQYHRAHFLDTLLARIPETVPHLGKRLISYSHGDPTGSIKLKFADGTSATCDILIGCDGIKSTVRRIMFQDLADKGQPEMIKFIEPVWTGEVVYRALIPMEHVPLRAGQKHRVLTRSTTYCQHLTAYPIAQGKWVNFGGFVTKPEACGTPWDKPWAAECDAHELIEHFSGWEPEVAEILELVQKPLRWAIFQIRPLPLFAHGTVVLLGDAAHAMTPHQGSGVGQAIEDAYVLARILGHPSTTRKNLCEALKAYEHVRLPFTNDVARQSAEAGAVSELRGSTGDDYARFAHSLRGLWTWVGGEDPEAQVQRAIKRTRHQEKVAAKALL